MAAVEQTFALPHESLVGKAIQYYRHATPVAFPPLESVAVDALGIKEVSLTVYNPATGQLESWDGHKFRARLLSPTNFDAVVDESVLGLVKNAYPTLAEARDDPLNHVSILIRSMGDTEAFVLASGDSVQRIQGKDADTTTMTQDITCNKADVTFEQLNFATKTLTAGANRLTANGLLISGAGAILTGSGKLGHHISNTRFHGATGDYGLRFADAADSGSIVENCSFLNNAAGNDIDKVASAAIGGLTITSCRFVHTTTQNSGYAVDLSTGTTNSTLIEGSYFATCTNGGVSINGINNRIEGCGFHTGGASGRLLLMSSPSSQNINSVVVGCSFTSLSTSDVAFECSSADADAAGLVLANNSFKTCTILGSQDAVWIGNSMIGCTIDFQSKSGIVVIGGDMTGATLQNIPSDIVFRSVKGQDDRGDITTDGDVFITDTHGLVVGHTAQVDFGATPELQVLGTGTPDSSLGFGRFEDNASGPDVRFLKSRGATIGANVIVQDGDTLGRFRFQGADGSDFNTTAAEILGKVDGSPSENDIPGVIVFRTRTAAGSLTDKMLLSNAGRLLVPITGSGAGLLLGGDALLYRSAADVLRTPDSLTVDGDATIGGNLAVSTFARVDATALYISRFGTAAFSANLIAERARGTAGSPTAVQSGDILFQILSQPHDGDDFDFGAYIEAVATENHSATAHGVKWNFYTVDNTTTIRDLRLTIEQDGTITIGGNVVVGGNVDGIDVAAIGTATRTIILTAAGAAPTTTSPCADPTIVEAGTNDVDYWAVDFNKDADEFAFWGPFMLPANYDGGTFNAIINWTTTATSTDGVAWAIQLRIANDGDDIDAAWGAAVVITDDAQGGANKDLFTDESGDITPAGSASHPMKLYVRVFRDVSDGNDDLGVDARFLGATLTYTTNAVSD